MGITRLRQGSMHRDGFMRGRCTLGSSQDMVMSRGFNTSHVQRGLYSDVLPIQRQRQGDLRLLFSWATSQLSSRQIQISSWHSHASECRVSQTFCQYIRLLQTRRQWSESWSRRPTENNRGNKRCATILASRSVVALQHNPGGHLAHIKIVAYCLATNLYRVDAPPAHGRLFLEAKPNKREPAWRGFSFRNWARPLNLATTSTQPSPFNFNVCVTVR